MQHFFINLIYLDAYLECQTQHFLIGVKLAQIICFQAIVVLSINE